MANKKPSWLIAFFVWTAVTAAGYFLAWAVSDYVESREIWLFVIVKYQDFLFTAGVLGGLVAATGQKLILGRRMRHTGWWVIPAAVLTAETFSLRFDWAPMILCVIIQMAVFIKNRYIPEGIYWSMSIMLYMSSVLIREELHGFPGSIVTIVYGTVIGLISASMIRTVFVGDKSGRRLNGDKADCADKKD